MVAKSDEQIAPQDSLASRAPSREISRNQRFIGSILRTIFVGCMLAVTIRVASPQSETVWSAYETPGDLVRLVLGLIVAVWVIYLLCRPPRDPGAYRTWLFLGLAAVPFALICAIAVWWPQIATWWPYSAR